MPMGARAYRVLLFSVFYLCVAALSAGESRRPATDKSAQAATAPAPSAPSSDASKYVGSETCKTCHEEIYNSWAKTPHWKTTLERRGGPVPPRLRGLPRAR